MPDNSRQDSCYSKLCFCHKSCNRTNEVSQECPRVFPFFYQINSIINLILNSLWTLEEKQLFKLVQNFGLYKPI